MSVLVCEQILEQVACHEEGFKERNSVRKPNHNSETSQQPRLDPPDNLSLCHHQGGEVSHEVGMCKGIHKDGHLLTTVSHNVGVKGPVPPEGILHAHEIEEVVRSEVGAKGDDDADPHVEFEPIAVAPQVLDTKTHNNKRRDDQRRRCY